MLERWTRAVLRRRALVTTAWLGVLVVGIASAVHLPDRLASSFAVPGSESDRARLLLAEGFGEQPEGTFTVVFETPRVSDELEAELERTLEEAARLVPTAEARQLRDGDGILYGDIATTLPLAEAKRYTDVVRASLAASAGTRAYVTGQPAIQRDLDSVVSRDLRRVELIAVPIALVILIAVFGLTAAVAIPLVFAACTITGTLAVLFVVAQWLTLTTYVTAIVELIGLGLAIDYSLLVVHRFREEAAAGVAADESVIRATTTAGRAVVTSGLAVTIGLAALMLVPLPFVRSLGLAGLLVPLVSIVAALTLQPVLLSTLGGGGSARGPATRFWKHVAAAVLGHPVRNLVLGVLVLALCAAPLFALRVTPGSLEALPDGPEAMRGLTVLTDGAGPGAVTPTQVVVDTGRPGVAHDPETRAAIDRLADDLFRDSEVLVVASGRRPPYVDADRRLARVVVVGRHEYGADPSRALVARLRTELVPAAGFRDDVSVAVGGIPPQGVDFVERAYENALWIVLIVMAVTYLVLLRAFRSLVIPLKAVFLNLLTVAAVCGLLVAVFQWGLGAPLGLPETPAVEAWVPIFLFATLFGLSMDYEVFLVSRMREAWDETRDTNRAIAAGLERSGRVVTAAAAIMIAAFGAFVSGSVVGLQQLGLGLALGVLIDATLVRMLVLPSLMAVLGRWNWWLPERVAGLARVEPSALPERA